MVVLISRFFLIFSILILFSCQSFPQGESLSDLGNPDNDGAPTDFSTVDLYRYFTLCRAVWREGDKWQKIGWDLDYFYDKNSNTLGLSLLREGVLHIAFRSSMALENQVDLKYNSKFGLKKVPFLEESNIRVFSGFLEKYSAIRKDVLDRIENTEADRIIFIGHSGGGAIASIAYLDIAHQFPEKDLKGVVFGPVRTFNSAGYKWFLDYNDRFIRIVNGRDPFSNLPPAFLGYRHVGRLVRIGHRSWYKVFSFKDHHPGYRTSLEELLELEGSDLNLQY